MISRIILQKMMFACQVLIRNKWGTNAKDKYHKSDITVIKNLQTVTARAIRIFNLVKFTSIWKSDREIQKL